MTRPITQSDLDVLEEGLEPVAPSLLTSFLNMDEGPAAVLMVIIASVFAVALWRIA